MKNYKISDPPSVIVITQSEEFADYIGMQIRKVDDEGKTHIATEIIFTEQKSDIGLPYGPTVVLEWNRGIENPAQEFMDSLWKTGLRPSLFKDSRSTHEAMTKHLDDMRKIVSKKLSVDL